MTASSLSADNRIDNSLIGISPQIYGPSYRDHTIEIYKIYIEMADRISGRREKTNSFFLAVNAALVAIITRFTITGEAAVSPAFVLLLALVAGLICYVWRRAIRSYRDLNTAKFKIVHAIERQLPLRPFDAEWESVGRGKNSKLYSSFTHVESAVPLIFMVFYGILAIYSLPWEAIGSALELPT